MNATLSEAEVERLEAFKMPRPMLGQQVLWRKHASPTEDPEIGFVLKAGARSIRLQTASGMIVDTVRHMSDPKLQLNEHQRENGAWEFPESAGLGERVAKLESTLDQLAAQVKSFRELLETPADKKGK